MKKISNDIEVVEPRMALLYPQEPLKHIEECARICCASKSKGSPMDFLADLLKRGHLSVFEHAAYVPSGKAEESLMRMETTSQPEARAMASLIRARSTQGFQTMADLWILNLCSGHELSPIDFLAQAVQGDWEPYKEYKSVRIVCTRGISAEFERHRTLSPTERSTRYCDALKGPIQFVMPRPAKWAGDKDSYEYATLLRSYRHAARSYRSLRYAGASPQYARDVLGLGLATTLTLSGSDTWMKVFVMKRYTPKAHPQAVYLIKQLCDACPELKDFCKPADIAKAEEKL